MGVARTTTRRTAGERRVELLAAALSEFAIGGLHGTSTETIARRAGISHAYLFRLFRTKKQLFIACAGLCLSASCETFTAAAIGETPQERLRSMGMAYRDMLADRELLLSQLQLYARALTRRSVSRALRLPAAARGGRAAVGRERRTAAGILRDGHAAQRRRVDGLPGARRRDDLVSVARVGHLGLGSNVGDRRANLQAAVDGLAAEPGIAVSACSSTYDTDPVGEILDQPSFLNAAVAIETALEPLELLEACKRLERDIGRAAGGPRHGPRLIDIDVLLLGELQFEHQRMRIPHAQVLARRFVLIPLLELDFTLHTPSGEALADALAGLGFEEGVRRAGPRLALAA